MNNRRGCIGQGSLQTHDPIDETNPIQKILMNKLPAAPDAISFVKSLLVAGNQRVGVRRAWDLYKDLKNGNVSEVDKLYGPGISSAVVPTITSLEDFRKLHKVAVSVVRRDEEFSKRPKRRRAQAENEGYSEPVVEPILSHWRFSPENKVKSLVEDVWKADQYASTCSKISEDLSTSLPGGDSMVPGQSDSITNILHRSLQQYARDTNRSILANELADYSNPYMMKKAVYGNLLTTNCVRNKLDESLVETLLTQSSPDFVKLRSNGPNELPGEVLEPLNAFRGIVDWSQDPQQRLFQKLVNVCKYLEDMGIVSQSNQWHRDSEWKYNHPFKNHLGFISTVPQGRVGGWGFGKPKSDTQLELERMRYPTLQRVAHSLSKDPQYNDQITHSISVLERSKGWDFSDKTKAVNTMKEVLDTLPSSKQISGRLDRALPMRVSDPRNNGETSTRRRNLVRYKPSNLLRRNKIRMYFRSMTALTPLSKRWNERRAKNAARSKKENKK